MLNEFPTDFLDFRDSPISEEILDIEDKVENFYLKINFDENEDLKSQCLDARNYLDSSKILLRNLLVLENENIKKYRTEFYWLLDNLGRIDRKIDELETETIEKLETIERYNETNFPNSPKIKKYVNFLIKCMEHLVYYPLKNAWDYFKEKGLEGKDLFLYSVFLELYNSSESLGSISAEKIKTSPKQQGISGSKASHELIGEEVEFAKPEEIQKEEVKIDLVYEKEIKKNEDREVIENEIFGDLG